MVVRCQHGSRIVNCLEEVHSVVIFCGPMLLWARIGQDVRPWAVNE
jgi:hypothetical protein